MTRVEFVAGANLGALVGKPVTLRQGRGCINVPNPRKTRPRIIGLLRERGVMRARDIVTALGVESRSLRVKLHKMVKAGQIRNVGYGLYAVAD